MYAISLCTLWQPRTDCWTLSSPKSLGQSRPCRMNAFCARPSQVDTYEAPSDSSWFRTHLAIFFNVLQEATWFNSWNCEMTHLSFRRLHIYLSSCDLKTCDTFIFRMVSLPSICRHSGEHYYLLGPWWVSIARGTEPSWSIVVGKGRSWQRVSNTNSWALWVEMSICVLSLKIGIPQEFIRKIHFSSYNHRFAERYTSSGL